MIFEVHNWGLNVGNIELENVSASSVFLIGDSEALTMNSFFDTPPESYTVGNIVPLSGV
ncbi:putative spore germination protein GerPD [Oceanobacillus picturae]|uniref:Spore germination protein GerPD n=1 Tax=Oceanobacillus picturae TaxID=171693 RepID=W9AB56_9BACI|nr:hypothetical protein [Oceanobacillus picturae]CDO02703.1 putative spore germination protein GerPD [Oceanobacillus picturae]